MKLVSEVSMRSTSMTVKESLVVSVVSVWVEWLHIHVLVTTDGTESQCETVIVLTAPLAWVVRLSQCVNMYM